LVNCQRQTGAALNVKAHVTLYIHYLTCHHRPISKKIHDLAASREKTPLTQALRRLASQCLTDITQ